MNTTVNHFRALIEAREGGKSFPAIDFVRKHTDIAATLSKLNTDPTNRRRYNSQGNVELMAPTNSNLGAVSRQIAQKDKDSETVMQLFPELELGAQILISSVLAPKDMNTAEINYTIPENLNISPIASQLLTPLKDYFTQTYKIEPLLPKILREELFGAGSYPMVVIPENSIDDMINGTRQISTEELKQHANNDGVFHSIGILGDGIKTSVSTKEEVKNFSMESFIGGGDYETRQFNKVLAQGHYSNKDGKVFALEHVFVTDNPDALKMPKIIEARNKLSVNQVLSRTNKGRSAALESFKKDSKSGLNDSQLTSLFYKNANKKYNPTVKVKTNNEMSRSTIGKPLVMKLPPESVIPVYTPGNPESHIGYYVLIDTEGNPIFRGNYASEFDSLRAGMAGGNTTDMSSHLLQKAAGSMGEDACKAVTYDQAAQVYGDIIDADLLARLRNGIYGRSVSLVRNDEVYRIMLARALKKQNTQILYVPKELLTYFAYKFDNNGIGKSLLDNMLVLQSLRAMVLFSKVQASVKNSIGRQRVKIKLDETDPDPQSTIEKTVHEIANMRRGSFPVSTLSVSDLTNWLQSAGLEFEFEGHPGLPDTAIEFNEVSSNYAKPDETLDEDLRKRSIMGIGLSPEMVENGFSTEFATTAVQNNLLLTKRVIQIQESFVPQITDHARMVATNDGDFTTQIREVIKENLNKILKVDNVDPELAKLGAENENLVVQLLLNEFLYNFEVVLAQPDSAQLENMAEAIEKYAGALDNALSYYVSADMLPGAFVGEEASQRADEIKAMVKAYCMRKWMAEKHILPELTDFVTTDEEGKPFVNLMEKQNDHVQALVKSIGDLLSKSLPVAQASDRAIQALTNGEELGASTASDTSSSTSSDSGSDNDANEEEEDNDPLDAGMPAGLPDLGSLE